MSKNKSHTHWRSGEGLVWWIPSNPDRKPELKATAFDLDSLSSFVGGYIEVIRPPDLPILECGCSLILVTNEEGLLLDLPPNPLASALHPPLVVGDVFLVAEGPVQGRGDNYGEPDFFGLPPDSFASWFRFMSRVVGS